MTTDAFQTAVQRARRHYSEAEWLGLTLTDQANAIYRELRRLDAEAAVTDDPPRVAPAVKDVPDLLW
jgi:hypothetical protein